MSNLMQIFEKEQIAKLTSKKNIPAFRPGDTLKVTVRILEGERSRFQAFEGICIARKNSAVNSKFTVRKISHGEGVEKVFPLFSSLIDKIDIIRKGDVRRAKLYYLRDRKGKSARISEKIKKKIGIDVSEQVTETEIINEETKVAGTKVESAKTEPKKEEPKKEAPKTELKKEKLKTEKK